MEEEEFEEIELHEIAVARRELSEAVGFGDEDKRQQIERLFDSRSVWCEAAGFMR